MSDPQTANIQLAQPTRGSDTGTWDVPVNGNSTILDGLLSAGNLTIGLNNTTVTLSSAQFINGQIIFNSTLTSNVSIVFPSSFTTSYEILNLCTGSSAFVIQLYVGSTSAGGQTIACPPGESFECSNDGTNFRYKNFGRVGSYWDYAGSSVPQWVSACTIPPYLNCTGGTFSAATYPTLNVILGSTTLPDARGRFRATLDQGAARLSTVLTSSTVGASGGNQQTTLVTANLPPYTPAGTVTTTVFDSNGLLVGTEGGSNQVAAGSGFELITNAITSVFAGAAQGGTSSGFSNVPPAYIGGLTMIRAA